MQPNSLLRTKGNGSAGSIGPDREISTNTAALAADHDFREF